MKSIAGMTLIELMVVVAILAVISAIAVPAYRGYISTSHRAECQTESAAIKLAEEEFFLQNGSYFPAAGTNVTNSAIPGASGGLYTAEAANLVNCSYSLTTPSPANGYRLIVTGTNALSTEGTIVDYSKN